MRRRLALGVLGLAQLASSQQLQSGSACSDWGGGLCTTCQECCADYTTEECEGCVSSFCAVELSVTEQHICMDGEDFECNVCDKCCNQPFLASQHACDTCVSSQCEQPDPCEHTGTAAQPLQCSLECVSSCWDTLSSPCIHQCANDPNVLLLLALLPFWFRLVMEYGGGASRRFCGQRPEYSTCVDRPYVQKEIRWAKQAGKNIITLFESEQHRPGYFDYAKAAKKYKGTEWEFLLKVDSIKFQRERFLAEAMLKNILAKAS